MEHSAQKVELSKSVDDGQWVLFLIKVGEIALKGENRRYFEARLRRNIRRQLEDRPCTVSGGNGRFYLKIPVEDQEWARKRLAMVFGITGFSRTFRVEKQISTIRNAAIQIVSAHGGDAQRARFKVEARRTDKHFPLRSYEIAVDLGSTLQERFPSLTVDVHRPDWTLNVEIREQAYLYLDRTDGPGGLPVGTAGQGILLLSGGIDSPVAGYLMAKRGVKITAVYFHAYPYTSEQARKKVESLARILSPYLGGLSLFVVPFTEVQMRIKERAPADATTLLMRACMMRIAERFAKRARAGCLITGESLGQVASQTMESIHFTGSMTSLPVFRPLVGMDKEEIIRIARTVGTFETSILPYEDCCTIFSPRHPIIRPDEAKMRATFEGLDAEALLASAADDAVEVRLAP